MAWLLELWNRPMMSCETLKQLVKQRCGIIQHVSGLKDMQVLFYLFIIGNRSPEKPKNQQWLCPIKPVLLQPDVELQYCSNCWKHNKEPCRDRRNKGWMDLILFCNWSKIQTSGLTTFFSYHKLTRTSLDPRLCRLCGFLTAGLSSPSDGMLRPSRPLFNSSFWSTFFLHINRVIQEIMLNIRNNKTDISAWTCSAHRPTDRHFHPYTKTSEVIKSIDTFFDKLIA